MKALWKEFLYEKKIFFVYIIIIVFLGIYYYFIFGEDTITFNSGINLLFINFYGILISQRKLTNFEKFLSITPIGRKSIVNMAYLMGILYYIVSILIFYIANMLRNYKLFFILQSTYLIVNSIFLQFYILKDKETNSLIGLLGNLLVIFLTFFSLFGISNLVDILLNKKIFTFVIVSIVFYIISYFITMKFYLKKDL